MTLTGKLFVTCPLNNEEVQVRKKCVFCSNFRHISWEGLKPLIACDLARKEYEKNVKPN